MAQIISHGNGRNQATQVAPQPAQAPVQNAELATARTPSADRSALQAQLAPTKISVINRPATVTPGLSEALKAELPATPRGVATNRGATLQMVTSGQTSDLAIDASAGRRTLPRERLTADSAMTERTGQELTVLLRKTLTALGAEQQGTSAAAKATAPAPTSSKSWYRDPA